MSTISSRIDSNGSSSSDDRTSTTSLLDAWAQGHDDDAFSRVLPRLYEDLCRVASRSLAKERRDHTLETRALVHEAYLRLSRERPSCNDRAHFFAVMSRVMRHVLVDHARRRLYAKRGGGVDVLPIDEALDAPSPRDEELVELGLALDALRQTDPDLARLVDLRYFGGLTVEETAEVLALSVPTVVRRWRIARSWLFDRLNHAA